METKTALEIFEEKINDIEKRIARRRTDIGALKPGARGRADEARATPLSARDNGFSPADENRFLKAEIESVRREKSVCERARLEAEAQLLNRDSEITRLFARNKQLEDENYTLRLRLNKTRFEEHEGFRGERHYRRRKLENDGLLAWLKKPLIRTGE